MFPHCTGRDRTRLVHFWQNTADTDTQKGDILYVNTTEFAEFSEHHKPGKCSQTIASDIDHCGCHNVPLSSTPLTYLHQLAAAGQLTENSHNVTNAKTMGTVQKLTC